MQLVELVVELRNHLLDVLTLLLDIDLRVNCPFDLAFVQQSFGDVSCKGFLFEHVLDLGVLVFRSQIEEILVDLFDQTFVDARDPVCLTLYVYDRLERVGLRHIDVDSDVLTHV